MSNKLSILQRQHNKTGWHQSNQFQVAEVQQILVNEVGQNKALNSIPSPFARMHLFETAFDMVQYDLAKESSLAGETFNRIVSDCLDVFELLYNWNSHIAEHKPLELVVWKKEVEIDNMLKSKVKIHKFLGETLNIFLQGEEAFKHFEKCLLIKYNGKVIAGSSPFTGFITAPDDLRSLGLLKPLSQVAYFSRTIPFSQRKPEIKKYIFDFFEENDFLKSSPFTRAIRAFLEWHNNDITDVTLELQPLENKGAQIYIFDKLLGTSKKQGMQYFEPHIIRLNYRLNTDCFHMPAMATTERSYDYLLPLTPSFFEECQEIDKFRFSDINKMVSIVEESPDTVKVTLTIGGRQIPKVYQKRKIHDQDGQIIDLKNDYAINFNLGIFPLLKISNQEDEADFNDFYRVMMVMEDLNYKYSNKDFELNFGSEGQIIENGHLFNKSRTDRTIASRDKADAGTSYYALNSCFDFVQVVFPPVTGTDSIKCMIVPKWNEKITGNGRFDFSIDFGTTSTFIAFTNDPDSNGDPQPFELNEKETFVAFLNRPKPRQSNASYVERFENALPDFLYSSAMQVQEFLPCIIKKKEKYEFPIRSVLYQQRSLASNQKNVLSNANISFIYQKKDAVTLSEEKQEFKPNLKWNIKTNEDFASSVKIFIEELFILIRTKILLNDGNPKKSKIYWFSPLSFTSNANRAYTELWTDCAKKYLKLDRDNIINLTESEAPFNYLLRKSDIKNPKAVLTLDIGGGSTDMMLYNNAKPQFGTSVHFGANVIWGNGFDETQSAKENGIYLAIKHEIAGKLNSTELKALNEKYTAENSKEGSDEIINFWIGNNGHTGVISRLNNGEFRLSYLLHLSALIYHSLKLMQARGQQWPTCIIFSGNGSKYIDLIHNPKYIAKIWGYFGRKIFGSEASDPQVILPENNRKEATCFGGLCKPGKTEDFSKENYLGFEKQGEEYQRYKDIEDNKEPVFKKLLSSFNELIDWFFEMNTIKELNFKNEFGIEIKPDRIKKYLLKNAEDNLSIGYLKRFRTVDRDDYVSDSLFYYPLVGLIYKLNKLTEDDLDDFVEKTVVYAGVPDAENEFQLTRISPSRKPDSIYTITVESEEPDAGSLTIIDDPEVHRRALGVYQGALNPVCHYTIYPQANQQINVVSKGKVRKEFGKWVVVNKIEIEFV